jgi:hypothetical protein
MVNELITGKKNKRIEPKIMNFIRYIDTISPKAAEIVSANLPGGPSKRWMQLLNKRERKSCLLESNKDEIKSRMLDAIERRQIPGHKVSFSLSIDATKVPSELEISTPFAAIMGGAYPNHYISTRDLSAKQIDSIMKQKNDTPVIVRCADELKVIIQSFQNCPPGVSPVEIVGARPQTSNETSSFTNEAVEAAIEASSENTSTQCFFTNFAVDGVSAESNDVMTAICKFLDGDQQYLGTVDNKHNVKNDRYQAIGGSCVASVGDYVVDCDLLRQANVPIDLWRVGDFASDKLAATLFSYRTLQKVQTGVDDGIVVGLVGDLCALSTLFSMMALHLHAVNGKFVPPKHRALYLFSSMLFFTSTSGISVTSKRNLVNETIGNLFLILQSNVKKIRLCTSEQSEHAFGSARLSNREFTVADFCLLSEKFARRMNALFEGDLSPSRTANKGYHATFLDWVVDAKGMQEEGGPCDIDVSYDASSVVSQLWPTAQKIIFESVRLVTPLLKLFGVVSEEMSPFCRDFASCRDLLETYVSYCPKTFSYKGFSGGGNNENSDDTELAETAGGHSHQQDVSNIIARFEHFTIDLMAAVTSPDDSEDGDELINVIFDKNDSQTTTRSEVSHMKRENANASLLNSFTSLCKCDKIEELFDCVLHFSATIELLDGKLESASLSQSRKTKTLFGRWTARKISTSLVHRPSDQTTSIEECIARDSIVTCKFKLDNRNGSPKITKDYRVLAVYEKFYNKWWMSRDKKVWSPTMDINAKKNLFGR